MPKTIEQNTDAADVAESCRLCREPQPLRESHVVPAFVYKWLKETSATGFLRFGRAPNLRVQDGYRRRWLCAECEARLNGWETPFATRVFHPLNDDSREIIRYGDWMIRFCASVSWRTLLFISELDSFEGHSEEQREAVNRALNAWRQFLMGEVPHPGAFEQHILVLGPVQSWEGHSVPANINRYFLRSVDLDVVRSASTNFVLTKLGKIVILGFISVDFPRQWVGTKIHASAGTIGGANPTVPKQFGAYLIEEARRFGDSIASISAAQRDKMNATMWKDIDRVAYSDSFRAMQHDVQLFGRAAFDIHKPRTGDE